MRIFDDLRSGLTPAVEELHQGWDETYPEPLRGRELITESVTAAAFLVTAVLMAALIPSEHSFDPALAAALVGTYAVLARVRFPIGHGFTMSIARNSRKPLEIGTLLSMNSAGVFSIDRRGGRDGRSWLAAVRRNAS